jgi:Carboxypeptidase regulatory-like domain
MTRTSLLAFLIFFGCCAAQGQRPFRRQSSTQSTHANTPYLITGTVVSSVDHTPVPHCHLSVSSAGRQFADDGNSFDCDEHGRFSVSVPSLGSWRLTASGRGFVTQAYQAHPPFSTAIVLTTAKPAFDLQFPLSPEAAITGAIVDEAGEAVRTAQVSLQNVPAPGPDGAKPAGGVRSTTRTDDRGIYEFGNIAPGDYRIVVQAQPWYAAASARPSQTPASTDQLDPSLDYAYPVTWFPGVDDPGLAETLTLHAGDVRQADFHLTPVPSVHLHILPPGLATTPGDRVVNAPVVQQIIPGIGGQNAFSGSIHFDPRGQADVGGLAPGLYQIRTSGQNAGSALVEVTAGSTRTLDLNAPSDEAVVTFHFEGVSNDSESRPVQINLINPETGSGTFPSFRGESGGGNFRRRDRDADGDRTLEVPPGRYEVVLQSRPNLYLTGITAKGGETTGRFLTVAAGASAFTLHVASGRASLTGVAGFQNKPSIGAMVLLVPTTIEEPGSFRILHRDQTDTDGGFSLSDVIPGEYILVAIDHGWEINWSDRSTLRHYLMQGVPVDLVSGVNVKQNVEAQAP